LDAQSGQNQGTGRFELTVSSQSEAQSRMVLEDDGITTAWKPDDQLVLVDKSGSRTPIYLDCTLEEGTASKATFVSESGVPAGAYWVIYNYNENLAYGNKTFESISDVNANNDLVLYAELNVVEGTSSASIEMKHLYALIRVVLKNLPSQSDLLRSYEVGMYSTQKGLPKYKQFTSNGLVNADSEYTYSEDLDYRQTYQPSNNRIHNLFLGDYMIEPRGAESTNQAELEGKVALVLPEDLASEEVFFYVYSNSGTCYEFKKSVGKVNLKAGTNYKVVLDFNDAENLTETKLQSNNDNHLAITSPKEWRHVAYSTSFLTGRTTYSIDNDIDFEGEYFIPIPDNVTILGNNHTLSNITLNRENENYVGIIESGSLVYDLTLENAKISGNNYVGAFGAYNLTVSNCKLTGNSEIIGKGDIVGGIVGLNYLPGDDGDLKNCSVGQNCIISGKNYVGGIVGAYITQGYWTSNLECESRSPRPILGCTSSATVKGNDYVGGIFGKFGGNIIRQENFTTISFSMDDATFTLSGCKNYGSVSGNNYVGGIGGDFAIYYTGNLIDRVVLSKSISEGTVIGNKFVGGITGASYGCINTCYSIGTIEAKESEAGGISGHYGGDMMSSSVHYISNSYSLADIKAGTNGYAGGILGRGGYATVRNSYYASKNMLSDGIVGYSDGKCTIENCLTAAGSLGRNLGPHTIDLGLYTEQEDDLITNSFTSVESILANKNIINGDNAYSDNIWTNYPYECVKFDSFSSEVENPDLDNETIE
jgi:hypothetical protein